MVSQSTLKTVIPISAIKLQQNRIAVIKDKIYDNLSKAIYQLPFNKVLLGTHKRKNIAASYAVCRQLKIDVNAILKGIASF